MDNSYCYIIISWDILVGYEGQERALTGTVNINHPAFKVSTALFLHLTLQEVIFQLSKINWK